MNMKTTVLNYLKTLFLHTMIISPNVVIDKVTKLIPCLHKIEVVEINDESWVFMLDFIDVKFTYVFHFHKHGNQHKIVNII